MIWIIGPHKVRSEVTPTITHSMIVPRPSCSLGDEIMGSSAITAAAVAMKQINEIQNIIKVMVIAGDDGMLISA